MEEVLSLAKKLASFGSGVSHSAPVNSSHVDNVVRELLPSVPNDLCELGVPPEVLTLLTSAISEFTSGYESCLKDHITTIFRLDLRQVFGLNHSAALIQQTRVFFEQDYRDIILPRLYHAICTRFSLTRTLLNPGSITEIDDNEPSKARFNDSFRPYLEKYFQYNAYPSRADQEHLARKSMMSKRQIEVFFQNRRRRWREAGKEPPQRHPSDPLPADLDPERWTQAGLAHFSLPEMMQRPRQQTEHLDILALWDNPESTFPATLPRDEFVPWHARTREPLPTPEWTRKPVSALPKQAKISMKELKHLFHKCLEWPLHSKGIKRPKSYLDTAYEPAVRAITVVPPPAPLPAFVHPRSPLLKQPQNKKKTSGLPKRLPKHPPVGDRLVGQSVMPSPVCAYSPSPSPIVESSSHTPSLEFNRSSATTRSSLQRQTSHSSLRSNRSSSSDGTPPSTPPDSSIALPGTASCVVLPTQFSMPMKPPTRQGTPAISVAGTDDHMSLFGDSDPLQELFEGVTTVLDSTTCNPSGFGQLPSTDAALGDLNALFADIENPLNFFSTWDLTLSPPSNAEFSFAF